MDPGLSAQDKLNGKSHSVNFQCNARNFALTENTMGWQSDAFHSRNWPRIAGWEACWLNNSGISS